MKAILFLISAVWLLHIPASGQNRVSSGAVVTEFSSKAAGPAQDIYAIDKTGEASLNLKTGDVSFKIRTKNFSLPRSLMQKHYNERYMQTDRFPLATFQGIVPIAKIPATDGAKEAVTVTGSFTVHGVTTKRAFQGTIEKKGAHYLIETAFEVRLADHNIEIPVLFFTKITEAVQVKVKADLGP